VHLDDPRLTPMMEAMEKHGMASIIHVSDPDIWFETRYTDIETYGTKADQYKPLEVVLRRHPGIKFIGAHMAGNPEHLDSVGDLLDKCPNYHVDTSATKWMVREISRQVDAARAFFVKYRRRILFGTDNFVRPDRDTHLYNTRYWAHQILWETGEHRESPIYDEDYGGRPVIRGLDLPADVLEDIYLKNACELLPELFSDLVPAGG
jgi:predicted TIM-barrel fold metal-dependent hydrolase